MRTLLLLMLGILATGSALGGTVRLRCHDGIFIRRLCASGCPQPVCDRDARCDGVCTFVVNVCGEAGCRDQTLVVPVGERQVVPALGPIGRLGPERAVLVCRHHPPRLPCPQPGGLCQSDADCPRLLGDPCVSCRAGICQSDPSCV